MISVESPLLALFPVLKTQMRMPGTHSKSVKQYIATDTVFPNLLGVWIMTSGRMQVMFISRMTRSLCISQSLPNWAKHTKGHKQHTSNALSE